MRYDGYGIVALLAGLSACSGSQESPAGEGGAAERGGFGAIGGETAADGHTNSGTTTAAETTTGGSGGLTSTTSSRPATGGKVATGGASAASPTGGRSSVGGSSTNTRASGGVVSTGGAQQTGGKSNAAGSSANTGGGKATGGKQSTGGTTSIQSTKTTGGNKTTGGSSATTGPLAVGATPSTGGSRTTGAAPTTGGTASTGNCDTPPASSELVGWASVDGGTTGGGNAKPTVVTTLADLQTAVKGTTAAVIYVKGVLAPGVLSIGSNKTIVGLCGAEIHGHVGLNKSSNVIIRNIKIAGYAVGDCSLDPDYSSGTGCSSGADAITVQGQSTHLWFDHCDISDGTDGNLDVTHASDYITISWTKFHYTPRTDDQGSDSTGASGHRYSNLIGGSDSNGDEDSGHLRITWHHDWWADNVVERQPRVRFGQVHLFNNLWTSSTTNYCIGLGVSANIRTENNIFIDVKTPINTTSYSDSASGVRSTGNVYTNTGSKPSDVNATSVFNPAASYAYAADATDSLEAAIRSGAGPK